MCEFDSKKLSSSKASFANAAKYDKTKKYADQWLQFVKNEEERIAQINKSLQQVRKAQSQAEPS
jgi:hypothetical protein